MIKGFVAVIKGFVVMIKVFVVMIRGFVFSCTILVLMHQGVKPPSLDARGSMCLAQLCRSLHSLPGQTAPRFRVNH